MDKKVKISGYMWGLIITLILGAIFIYISRQKIESSKQEMNNYTTSEFCASEFDCRNILNAIVLKSTSIKRIIYYSGGKWNGTATQKRIDVNFYVKIQDQNNEIHEIYILPKTAIDLNKVDMPEDFTSLYIGENENFAENSFPHGSQISFETWHGKVTSLFSQFVNSPFENTGELFFVIPNTLGNIGQISISELEENKATAIPSTENPIIIYSTSLEQYEQSKIAVGFLSIILFVLSLITHKK